eukprot:647879-Prymnesium_polylepis.1
MFADDSRKRGSDGSRQDAARNRLRAKAASPRRLASRPPLFKFSASLIRAALIVLDRGGVCVRVVAITANLRPLHTPGIHTVAV